MWILSVQYGFKKSQNTKLKNLKRPKSIKRIPKFVNWNIQFYSGVISHKRVWNCQKDRCIDQSNRRRDYKQASINIYLSGFDKCIKVTQ